jgi:BirA family transcriptional regulator, biotin operon repressor / biotin---[acetyl-CoA-carboxylase] ligase
LTLGHPDTFILAEAAAAAGFKLTVFPTIGSTNDAAFELARDGANRTRINRTWVVARAQTAGRGRHGRQWQSPPGNLYASLLLVDAVAPRSAPQLGFAAGVALACALRRLLSDASRIRVKWPNDILLDGAKLAGILVEGRALPDGAYVVVVGFGVNCQSRPPDLPYQAAALAETNAMRNKAEDVLALLSEEMAHWLQVFEQGFDAIRAEWLTLAAGIGAPIKVKTATQQFEGIFQSIDAMGRLILADASGTHAIEAGDVLLGH